MDGNDNDNGGASGNGGDGMDNGNGASDGSDAASNDAADAAAADAAASGAVDMGSFGGSVSAVDGSQGQGQSQGPGSPGTDSPGNTDVSGNAPSDGTGASVDSNTIGGAPTMSFTGADLGAVGIAATTLAGAGLAISSGNPLGIRGGTLGVLGVGIDASTPGTALNTAVGHGVQDIGTLGGMIGGQVGATIDRGAVGAVPGVGLYATEAQTVETGAQPNDMSFLTDLGFRADPPPAAAPAPVPTPVAAPIAAPLPAPTAIMAAGPVAVNNYHALLNLGFMPN